MNWVVFGLLAWLFLGLEAGFRQALQIGHLDIAPSFVMILLVFVSLWARPIHALWAGILLGAGLDLLNLVTTTGGEDTAILGPWALAGLVAAYTVLNFRVMMFRRNPLTIAFLCAVAGGISGVVVMAILALRAFYDPIVIHSASRELGERLGSAVYTGVISIVVGPMLQFVGPWLGFRRPVSMAPMRR
jgi:hypothetical protein